MIYTIIKISGALIVFSSSVIFGHMINYSCLTRIKLLENMLSCLIIMETEIRYAFNNIETIVKKIENDAWRDNKMLFKTFLENIKNSSGDVASNIWKKSVDNIGNSFYTKKDREIIKKFGNVLGSGDIDTQIKNIEIFRNDLSLQLRSAREKQQKYGIVSKKISIYIGILSIIIFI